MFVLFICLFLFVCLFVVFFAHCVCLIGLCASCLLVLKILQLQIICAHLLFSLIVSFFLADCPISYDFLPNVHIFACYPLAFPMLCRFCFTIFIIASQLVYVFLFCFVWLLSFIFDLFFHSFILSFSYFVVDNSYSFTFKGCHRNPKISCETEEKVQCFYYRVCTRQIRVCSAFQFS